MGLSAGAAQKDSSDDDGLSSRVPRPVENRPSSVDIWDDTGSSGEGFYGYVIDFTNADPEAIVELIQTKHGRLSFNVGRNFFEDLEPEEE
jgi:hypothetical protein